MTDRFVISIPIGAYHPLLQDCLRSLAVQSPRPRVALMDASGDARVKALADAFDDLIVYRRHGPDKGQSDAIVEGWSKVDGEILGWLNADDALYPDALRFAAARFDAAPGLEVVCGHSVIINDEEAVTGYHWAVEPPSEALLRGDTISQPSCFFRRSVYDRVGGLNADLHYTMDWDLWVRFWRAGASFDFIDEVLSRVLWTADAKTGGFNKRRREELGRILDDNPSLAAKVKSRIGFGLNYLFEYVLPRRVAVALRRRVAASGATINGLGQNGEIRGGFALPLVHYRDAEVRRVTVAFLAGAHCVHRATVDGEKAPVARVGERLLIDLPRPLAPGNTSDLRLETAPGATATFYSLTLE